MLSKKEKLSKNGQKYAFLTISDQDNSFEVTVFPDVFAKSKDLLIVGNSLLLDASIKIDGENIKILGTSVQNIDKIMETQKVFIEISENADIDNLYNALAKIPDGNNEISFIIRKQNGSKIEVKTQYSKNMSFENRTIISQIKGVSFYNLAQ